MGYYKVQEDSTAQKGLKKGDNVVTAGGTYKIQGVNPDGSYKSVLVSGKTTSTYNKNYDNDNGAKYYKEALNQSNRAADATAFAAVNSLDNTKNDLNSKYNNTAKQAYSSYLDNQRVLPEQLAKLGLKGQGTAESSAVAMNNTYGKTLADIEADRTAALKDVDTQIANAYLSASNAKAKAAADYDTNMANLTHEDKWNNKNFDNDNSKWERSFNYRQQRDEVGDSQWDKEFVLKQYQDNVKNDQWNKQMKLKYEDFKPSNYTLSQSQSDQIKSYNQLSADATKVLNNMLDIADSTNKADLNDEEISKIVKQLPSLIDKGIIDKAEADYITQYLIASYGIL